MPMGPPKAEHCRTDFRYERRCAATRVRRMHMQRMAFQEHLSTEGRRGSIVPGRFSVANAQVHTIIHFVDFLKAAKRETPIALTAWLVDTMVRLFRLVAVGYCLDNGLALTPQMVRPVAADCVRHR
jgi:hypothetical protein